MLLVIIDGWPIDTRECLTALTTYLPPESCVVAIDCGNVDGAGEVLHELAVADSRIHEFHLVQTLNEAGWSPVVLAGINMANSEFFGVMDLSTIWDADALTPLLPVLIHRMLLSQGGEELMSIRLMNGAALSMPLQAAPTQS